jgi:hypothetical protein
MYESEVGGIDVAVELLIADSCAPGPCLDRSSASGAARWPRSASNNNHTIAVATGS